METILAIWMRINRRKSPGSEAEVISMAAHCLEELGLEDFEIHIRKLGNSKEHPKRCKYPGQPARPGYGVIDKGDVKELISFT